MASEEQGKRAAKARKRWEEDPTDENEQAFREAVEELQGKRRRVADKPLTDLTEEGVADYFTMMFRDELRYVPKFGWFCWRGSHWEQDENGEVFGCFREVTARLQKQRKAMPGKDEGQKAKARAFGQFVARMRSARSHDAVLKIASRDTRLVAPRSELDRQPALLPCLNGTVDLHTGELGEAKREDLLSRVIPLQYDPDATAPKFDAFLATVQPDPRMREFLQRLWGYGLFGYVREHIFPILYGDGANGKSVLAQVVQSVVGEYAQTVPRSVVVDMGRDQHKTQIARLHRTRIGIIHETQRDARLNVEAVKALTGGDVLTGNFMRQDFFDFVPTHTLYLLSNFKPQVDNALKAVWRRLLLVPFNVEIPESEQDLSLADKIIEEESAGVLRWLVEGAAWWWTFTQCREGASGLLPPQRVIDETKEYQRDEDVVGRFVEDCCELGSHCKVGAAALYKVYREYCKDEGVDKPASNNKFAEAVTRVRRSDGERISKKRHNDGRYYEGIGLPAPTDGDPRVPDDEPEKWGF